MGLCKYNLNKMPIYRFEGDCGSGKTLLMSYLASLDFKNGYPVYANYHLNFKFTHLKSSFFKNYATANLMKCSVCFDELALYYSSRQSMTKRNISLRPFILQTRKSKIKLYYTSQQSKLCDVNIRDNTDKIFYVEMFVKRKPYPIIKKPEDWNHKKGDTYLLKYTMCDKENIILKTMFIEKCEKIFNLYDTNEILEFEDDEE